LECPLRRELVTDGEPADRANCLVVLDQRLEVAPCSGRAGQHPRWYRSRTEARRTVSFSVNA
jgi:hypothetical protein